jgi:tetratricopeptide (TPR) repeat protein
MGLSTIAGDAADQHLSLLAGLLAWAHTARRLRRTDPARSALELAKEIARDAGADLHGAEARLLLVDLEVDDGRLDAAEAALAEAARTSGALGPHGATRLELASGRLALRRGDAAAAAVAFRRALGNVRKATRHPDLTVQASLGLATAVIVSRDIPQARRRLQSALRMAERHHLDSWRGRALAGLAEVETIEHQPEKALAHLSEAGRVLSSTDDHHGSTGVEMALGRLLLHLGRPADAISPLQRALQRLRDMSDRRGELEALLALGRAALGSGAMELAWHTGDEASALAEVPDEPGAKARASALSGRALLALHRNEEVASALAAAVSALVGAGAQEELAEAATDLSTFYAARGAHDLAGRYRTMAVDASRAGRGVEPWPVNLIG